MSEFAEILEECPTPWRYDMDSCEGDNQEPTIRHRNDTLLFIDDVNCPLPSVQGRRGVANLIVRSVNAMAAMEKYKLTSVHVCGRWSMVGYESAATLFEAVELAVKQIEGAA